MDTNIPIHKLAAQVGLTSRTLRHWESENLFYSMRDKDSGWRVYDETAVLHIHITMLLRQLDIPIKEIKTVLENKTYYCLCDVIKKQLATLESYHTETIRKQKRLAHFLSVVEKQKHQEIFDIHLPQLLTAMKLGDNSKFELEEHIMSESRGAKSDLQFITLPPMRTVYNVAVSVSPEDEAMTPVFEWLEDARLTGTARMFGGNMPPLPSGMGKPYGYGMCASIPDGITIPEHLKEMHLPGGVYAMLESTDDISGSWNKLMKLLSVNEKYASDRSRLCLEEHIRKDNNSFLIILLEPVKAKN